jgi:hypothetical protein
MPIERNIKVKEKVKVKKIKRTVSQIVILCISLGFVFYILFRLYIEAIAIAT